MPVIFRCFYCRGKLSIARRKAGQDVVCPRCQATITVPAPVDPGAELTELMTAGNVGAVQNYAAANAEDHTLPSPPEYAGEEGYSSFDVEPLPDIPYEPPAPLPPKKKPAATPKNLNEMPLFEGMEIERILAKTVGPEPLPPETKVEEKPKVGDYPNLVSDDAVVISRAKATMMLIAAVAAMGLAFAAGFWVRGR